MSSFHGDGSATLGTDPTDGSVEGDPEELQCAEPPESCPLRVDPSLWR
jgi:hypothetical protein